MIRKMVFFPGCVIPNRYPGVEKAVFFTIEKLGIDLRPLEGYSCCPPPGIMRSINEKLWYELATRNIKLSKNVEILTACNGCFSTLHDAYSISGGKDAKIRHYAEFLYRDVGIGEIRKKIKKFLPLKIAVHYGCHLVRPSIYREVDSPENPVILDRLVEAIGAESIPYSTKMVCCGAGGGIGAGFRDLSLKILKRKLEYLPEVDCIVVVCPLCQYQFDMRQEELRKDKSVPVLHYAQLLAVAFGLEVDKIGLEAHNVMNEDLISKLITGDKEKE